MYLQSYKKGGEQMTPEVVLCGELIFLVVALIILMVFYK